MQLLAAHLVTAFAAPLELALGPEPSVGSFFGCGDIWSLFWGIDRARSMSQNLALKNSAQSRASHDVICPQVVGIHGHREGVAVATHVSTKLAATSRPGTTTSEVAAFSQVNGTGRSAILRWPSQLDPVGSLAANRSTQCASSKEKSWPDCREGGMAVRIVTAVF